MYYTPPPPNKWQQKFQGAVGGGVQKEAISEGVGGCYGGLFPDGLSEIGELLIIGKTQLVVCYQCCILIGWATTRLYVIAHQ